MEFFNKYKTVLIIIALIVVAIAVLAWQYGSFLGASLPSVGLSQTVVGGRLAANVLSFGNHTLQFRAKTKDGKVITDSVTITVPTPPPTPTPTAVIPAGLDARVKSDLIQLRTLAEIIYDRSASSYATVADCFNSPTVATCKEVGIQANVTAIRADLISSGGSMVSSDTASKYCVSSRLPNTPSTHFCIDSTGAAKVTNSSCVAATCP